MTTRRYRKFPQPASQRNMSDEDFQDKKSMEDAYSFFQAYYVVILWAAAITTWAFGFLASLDRYSPGELDTMSGQALFSAYAWATVAGLLGVLFLDGSRWAWSKAKSADKSTAAQMVIAWTMEALNFGGSLGASALTFPFLLEWIGVPFQLDTALLMDLMKVIYQIAFAGNIMAAFIYSILSVKGIKMFKLSRLSAKLEGKILTKLQMVYDDAEGRVEQYFGEYSDELSERHAMLMLTRLLSKLDHGAIDLLPEHAIDPNKAGAPALPDPSPTDYDLKRDEWALIGGKNGHMVIPLPSVKAYDEAQNIAISWANQSQCSWKIVKGKVVRGEIHPQLDLFPNGSGPVPAD